MRLNKAAHYAYRTDQFGNVAPLPGKRLSDLERWNYEHVEKAIKQGVTVGVIDKNTVEYGGQRYTFGAPPAPISHKRWGLVEDKGGVTPSYQTDGQGNVRAADGRQLSAQDAYHFGHAEKARLAKQQLTYIKDGERITHMKYGARTVPFSLTGVGVRPAPAPAPRRATWEIVNVTGAYPGTYQTDGKGNVRDARGQPFSPQDEYIWRHQERARAKGQKITYNKEGGRLTDFSYGGQTYPLRRPETRRETRTPVPRKELMTPVPRRGVPPRKELIKKRLPTVPETDPYITQAERCSRSRSRSRPRSLSRLARHIPGPNNRPVVGRLDCPVHTRPNVRKVGDCTPASRRSQSRSRRDSNQY